MGKHREKKRTWPRNLTLAGVALALVGAGAVVLALLPGAGGLYLPGSDENQAASTAPQNSPSVQPSETQIKQSLPPEISFTVAATGDVLTHAAVSRAAWDGSRYNLHKLLEPIKPYLESADLALCHQEVAFGSPGDPPRDFPNFSMPAEMAGDLRDLGYDGCSTASNHTWDLGTEGAMRTLQTLQDAGLGVTGSRQKAEETPWQMYELTKEGRTVKIAHLSFTYMLNQGTVSYVVNNPWAVEIANPSEIIQYAQEARMAGAEVVLVSRHSGIEYQFEPSPEQKKWDNQLAQSGVVDLVIGHHPHVAQRIEKLPGGIDGQGMWTYWSLGNILSGQLPSQSVGTQMEEIAYATITVPAAGPVKVEPAYVIAMLDRVTSKSFPMQPFLQGNPPTGTGLGVGTVQNYYANFKEIMGEGITEITKIPGPASSAQVKALPRV